MILSLTLTLTKVDEMFADAAIAIAKKDEVKKPLVKHSPSLSLSLSLYLSLYCSLSIYLSIYLSLYISLSQRCNSFLTDSSRKAGDERTKMKKMRKRRRKRKRKRSLLQVPH
jgi:hypothetical protein